MKPMKNIYVAVCSCGEDVFADEKPTSIELCLCGRWNTPGKFTLKEVADITSEKIGWMGLDSQGNENGP